MSPSEYDFSHGEFHEGLTSRCTVFVFSTWPIWRSFIIARGISQICNQPTEQATKYLLNLLVDLLQHDIRLVEKICMLRFSTQSWRHWRYRDVFHLAKYLKQLKLIFCCLLLLVLKSSSILCNAFLFLTNKKGSKMQIFGGNFREKHHFK